MLEVLLATTLLLGAVMALSRLLFVAQRHAIAAEDETLAQLLCQNTMQELLAGIEPLQAVSAREVDQYPQWTYSVDIEPLTDVPLIAITVTLTRLPDEDQDLPVAGEDAMERPLHGFRLIRWVRSGNRQLSDSDLEQPLGPPPPPLSMWLPLPSGMPPGSIRPDPATSPSSISSVS